ncbi:nuclear transport factor 2 family protein [Sphingobium sp.]|uniref:nuclear transport factor 2 family protein n=1 Tax=Sphingobium sp. TaxID=1912891 RepID=UPI0028BF5055|nr:nuclear transport factor 2 family protein [Sphingobium sp.]
MNQANPTAFARFADQLEIQNCLYRFARGVDRRDYEVVRGTYHADAIDNHGDYNGGVDGMITWLRERHRDIAISFHHIGNIHVEFTGPDDALCEAYVLTWQSLAGADPENSDQNQPVEAFFAGRYVDHFKRKNGIWRCQHRTAVPESATLLSAGARMSLGPNWTKGSRDLSDPSYLLKARLET